MASAKLISAQQNGQQRNKSKKCHGRPQKRQERKSVTKDENTVFHPVLDFCVISDIENNELQNSNSSLEKCHTSCSPFMQINGEQNYSSRKRSKEPTKTTSKSTPAKKRRTTSTAESAAKRRRKTQKSLSKSSESDVLAPELQNWIPIGKPWAEMISIGSSPAKKAACCFPAVKHKTVNITFNILDVISVAAAGEEEDGDNIGKIDRIFFDKKLGMCANVLWYYKYKQCILKGENREKIEMKYNFDSRELLASKHTDTISCDSIQSHAFVLTFNEYCRYIAENKYDSLPAPLQSRCKELWPRGEKCYPRRRFLPHEDTPQELVYFCRKYYSIARKGIYSCAPIPTTSERRRIMRRRPMNQLLPVGNTDMDKNGNCDKSP